MNSTGTPSLSIRREVSSLSRDGQSRHVKIVHAGQGHKSNLPARANQVVPVGTMGKAIPLRVSILPAGARKVVKQIGTPRSPDPIMRRPPRRPRREASDPRE